MHIAQNLEERVPKEILQLIDDIISHAKIWTKFLEQWRYLLDVARRCRLRFSTKKTLLYDSEIHFCG